MPVAVVFMIVIAGSQQVPWTNYPIGEMTFQVMSSILEPIDDGISQSVESVTLIQHTVEIVISSVPILLVRLRLLELQGLSAEPG